MILAYLEHLERSRGNGVHTRNARLTAIRSFFHHVAASDPALIGTAQRRLSIPSKKSDVPMVHHLFQAELDILLDAPSKDSPLGRRDRTLLLFLARTGARVSEALGVEVADLLLDGLARRFCFAAKVANNVRFPWQATSPQQSTACCASAALLGTSMYRYSSAPAEGG